MHHRPPAFVGRSDLETLLASDNAADWCAGGQALAGREQGCCQWLNRELTALTSVQCKNAAAHYCMAVPLPAACRVAISEMLLGPSPPGFVFTPKHKANSYASRPAAADFPAGMPAGAASLSGQGVEEEEY